MESVDLAIPIPGLDTIIPTVAGGRVVVVESGADFANSFFLRTLAHEAIRGGRPVTFVTSRDRSEVEESLGGPNGSRPPPGPKPVIHAVDVVRDLEAWVPRGGLLAVDSFSYLTLDLDPQHLARLLRDLLTACRTSGSVATLATDRGMFDPRAEAVAIHLVDGYIQFHAREGNDGLLRYLRIPKWTDGRFLDRNVYYTFDGKRLAIDLRQRVI